MDTRAPEKSANRRWRDVAAYFVACVIAFLVITGVRSLLVDRLGGFGGTLAGIICAAIAVWALLFVVHRFTDRSE